MVTWFGQVHQESWQSITRNKEKQRNTCPACLPPYILNLISKILKCKSQIVLNFGRGENLEKALSTSLKHATCLTCFCGEEKEQTANYPSSFLGIFSMICQMIENFQLSSGSKLKIILVSSNSSESHWNPDGSKVTVLRHFSSKLLSDLSENFV